MPGDLPTVDAIKRRIQALADATGDPEIRARLGAVGSRVLIPDDGEVEDTGGDWEANGFLDLVVRGIGDYIDQVVVAKLNELIAGYSLVRTAHDGHGHVENKAAAYVQNSATDPPAASGAAPVAPIA